MQNRDPANALPLPLLRPEDKEYCPCGSRKKWKKCHGVSGCPVRDTDNPAVDAVLLGLTMNLLELLKYAIESVELSSDFETQLRQHCLLYFAKKTYRVTLAGLTLIRRQQSSVAFTLKRDQFYAWVAFHYYLDNQRQSTLFGASGPLRQRDNAREIMSFNPDAASDPERKQQLSDLEKTADALYAKFRDLKVPRGKSGSTKTPVFRDWKEPDEYDMVKDIVSRWPDEMVKSGNPIPPHEVAAWCERQVRSMQFFHSAFPSQEMHGTPMGFIGDLSRDDETPAALNADSHEPNGLIYIYLWYPLGVARKLVEFAGASGFTDRLTKIMKAAMTFREIFGFADPSGH